MVLPWGKGAQLRTDTEGLRGVSIAAEDDGRPFHRVAGTSESFRWLPLVAGRPVQWGDPRSGGREMNKEQEPLRLGG